MTSLKTAARETKLSIEWYKWRAQVKREPLYGYFIVHQKGAQVKREPLYKYLIMTPEILPE